MQANHSLGFNYDFCCQKAKLSDAETEICFGKHLPYLVSQGLQAINK